MQTYTFILPYNSTKVLKSIFESEVSKSMKMDHKAYTNLVFLKMHDVYRDKFEHPRRYNSFNVDDKELDLLKSLVEQYYMLSYGGVYFKEMTGFETLYNTILELNEK